MIRYQLWLCFLGITACLVVGTVSREAIIYGIIAKAHQFPYNVALLYNGEVGCGGGIINDDLILTAAHCVAGNHIKDHHRITILAGTIQSNKTYGEHVIMREAEKAYLPKDYDPSNEKSSDDIAIIKLKHNLGLSKNKHLKALKLPKSKHEDYIGKTAKIAGFGWQWIRVDHINNIELGGRYDAYLRFIEVDVLSPSQTEYSKYASPKVHICARINSNPRVGVCNGDSGGPLVHDEETVIGILSLSPYACWEEDEGGIYTRVSYYLNFIQNVMKGKNDSDIKILRLSHSNQNKFKLP